MSDAEARIHPLVPPLALGVITLLGAALLIGFGGETTETASPVTDFRGGKVAKGPARTGGGEHGGGKVGPGRKTAPVRLVWLVRELGPHRPSAPLVRRVAPGFRVTFTRRGYAIAYQQARLKRWATGFVHAGRPQRFVHGVSRQTAFGEDVTVLRAGAVSAYLVVRRRRGTRLWTWHLETNLAPRVRRNGSVLLRGRVSLLVQPPQVYDRRGREITPNGARWRLEREIGGWQLAYLLDDSRLRVPYAISG